MPVRDRRVALAAINVLGGLAVLGSYVHGLATHPEGAGEVWGGVPAWLRPVYTTTMLLAAAGYFPFTYVILFRLDPRRTRVGTRLGYGVFPALYAAVLGASALWMPLTFAMLEAPSAARWLAVRLVLAVAGLGSVGILAALLAARPRPAGAVFGLAVAGCLVFCLQTAVLDALVWPAYFPF